METMKILEKNILKIISNVCVVPKENIIRNRKSKKHSNLVLARQILVNVLWNNFNYTNYMIRDVVKYKNHASVVHHRRNHETDYEYRNIYRERYDEVMDQIGLYISDEDIEKARNRDLNETILDHEKMIGKYKELWLSEKLEKEKYQQELITFKKKYIPM